MERYGKVKGVKKRSCSKCGGDLGDRYGKQRYCRSCHAASMRKNRPKHSNLKPLAKLKANARAYAHEYLKRGKIQRHGCEVCGSKAEMHHEDYSKPIQVRWFCRVHHLKLHNECRTLSDHLEGGTKGQSI